MKAAGDGVLAMFDAPSAALHCAFAICAAARAATSRHAQRCTRARSTASPTAKSAVSRCRIAERVLAHADMGEVLVTQTVRDAVYGSSLAFRSRGGVDLAEAGSWDLFTAIPE